MILHHIHISMAKEKLTRKEIESAIEEKKNFLVSEMTKL